MRVRRADTSLTTRGDAAAADDVDRPHRQTFDDASPRPPNVPDDSRPKKTRGSPPQVADAGEHPVVDGAAERELELFSTRTSKDSLRKRARWLLARYRQGFCDLVGREVRVTSEDADGKVVRRLPTGRFEVRFARARKNDGTWSGDYARDELEVLGGEEVVIEAKRAAEAEWDDAAPPPKQHKPTPKRPAAPPPPPPGPRPDLGISTRTKWREEKPKVEALIWETASEDETDAPLNQDLPLPPLGPNKKRVFCRKATITTAEGSAPFELDRAGGDDPRGCLMPRVRICGGEDEDGEVFDEYFVAVHEMYYDLPLDDDGEPLDDDGDDAAAVDLMLVFAYMYTKKMLEIDADSPLPPGALETLSPPFDGERELAEDREVDGLTPTSADYVRGCVSVSWHRTTVAGRYFRVREIADGRIYTARSTPDLEAAKRTKQLFVGL